MPILEFRESAPGGADEAPAASPATPWYRRLRPRLRRPRWRKVVRKLHLWTSFAAGIVLLVVVVSGAVLVVDPEIHQLTEPQLYDATPSQDPVTPAAAIRTVNRELPDWGATTAIRNRGIYMVDDRKYERRAFVDPGTGALLGTSEPGGGVMGFLKNLHMCGLTCKEYPGYVPALKSKVDLLGNNLPVGGWILGLSGLVLAFMALSGLVLWWPGIKRFARGFRVRRKKGAYSTHYDLHKVVGFVAVPFLLMWAVTGMGFEFKQVEEAWYAALPGDKPKPKEEYASYASKPGTGPGIGPAEAEAAALAAVPDSKPVSLTLPAKDDREGYYDAWVSQGNDPYRYYEWPGSHEVAVDRWSGKAKVLWPGEPDRALSRRVFEDYNFTVHAGTPFGWIPRLVWVAFGLVPVLLAVTGVSMWLIKRRRRRRRPPASPSPGAAAA